MYVKDIKNAMSHLKTHQKYPATKEELVKECDNLSDFSEEDKRWFESNLENKTYSSAEEVMQTLGFSDTRTQNM